MIQWYAFKPADTLFFKGSTPMVMGENHSASFKFPPTAETICGAIRTTVLLQNNIPFHRYMEANFGETDDEKIIIRSIGMARDTLSGDSSPIPFQVTGPLLQMDQTIYLPAPCSWYIEKEDKEKRDEKGNPLPIPVYRSAAMNSPVIRSTSKESLFMAKGRIGELTGLGGRWISMDDFFSDKSERVVRTLSDFFSIESRTGIALHPNRKVRESHLYTFHHARLGERVKLLFGIHSDTRLPLLSHGIMKLGGEQRIGHYEALSDHPALSRLNRATAKADHLDRDGLYMGLSDIEMHDKAAKTLVATDKLHYLGGWDMAKGFHKPVKGYYPQGSVFTYPVSQNMVAMV